MVLSVVGFAACLITGLVTQIAPLTYVAWQLLGGLIVWLYLAVYFHNFGLAEQEKRDENLLKSKQSTIFESSQQREVLFNVARKRLKAYERWGSIVFSLIAATYYIGVGIWMINKVRGSFTADVSSPLLGASAMVLVWFASFLLARFATGMSAERVWRPLKAGGNCLLSTSLVSIIMALALAARFFHYDIPMLVACWAVPVVMLIFGAEALLNTILDIYRPHIKGAYHSPGLESRLFGIVAEPGGILHTAASTIDYQFGFKVSQTWFYKLLEKAVMPLLLLLAVCMYSVSCFVVVGPGQMGVVEHLGSTDNGARVIGPGMHMKLPTPFEKVYVHDTERIQQIDIGSHNPANTAEAQAADDLVKKPLLWGQKHGEVENVMLVATESTTAVSAKDAPPVSMVVAVVPLQYRVSDIYKFLYNHKEPQVILESIARREITRFMASARLETNVFGGQSSDNESILGAGRMKAGAVLQERIQAAADSFGLGVMIVNVGLQGLHPPMEVAPDYENVIGAVQQRQQSVLEALAERNKVITELGGTLEEVEKLYAMLTDYENSKDSLTAAQQQAIMVQIDEAFAGASGLISEKLSEAEVYAYQRAELARAAGERFSSQVQAFEAAPEIYLQNQRLLTLENSLAGVRKYVIVSQDTDSEVIVVDLQEKLNPDLYDIEVPQ
jgi:regulator of protease activity HflC (stomatin/prohibitin superfamily)